MELLDGPGDDVERYKNMNDRLVKGASPNSIGFASPSGWINEGLFADWLQHFIKFAKPTMSEKHIVILDGHSSHKSLEAVNLARDNDVILISLPPHITHRIQPLDIVFYGPLKTAYNQEADKWTALHPVKRLSDYEVEEAFGRAYSRVANVDKGRSGSEHSAIFPYNPNRFSDNDFQTLSVVRPEKLNTEAISSALSDPGIDQSANAS